MSSGEEIKRETVFCAWCAEAVQKTPEVSG